MILYQSQHHKVEKDGIWIIVNEKAFGFTMTSDTGEKFIVVHRTRVGQLGKEYGFYIPLPLVGMSMIFETASRNGKYVHYLYRRDKKQRLVKTDPEIFIALTRLEVTEDAQHITKPRRTNAQKTK